MVLSQRAKFLQHSTAQNKPRWHAVGVGNHTINDDPVDLLLDTKQFKNHGFVHRSHHKLFPIQLFRNIHQVGLCSKTQQWNTPSVPVQLILFRPAPYLEAPLAQRLERFFVIDVD